jgi:lipopolysaccharide transport system permease protein
LNSLINYLLPWRHAGLIWQFARRAVYSRYRQSWLGLAWLLLTPLLMLAVYTLVFRQVFRVRWVSVEESNLAFALRLYAGLAVFNFFSECVHRAPGLILSEPHLVKKVVFPLEILPWVNLVSAMVQLGIAWAILFALGALDQGKIHITTLALPVVWLPLVPLILGLSWLLAAIGTFVRDIDQLVAMAVSLLMFLSPIFFPVEALPDHWRQWVFLNPLASVITQTRHVLLDGMWPDWWGVALNLVACSVLAMLGSAFFRAARSGFADVC